MTVLLHRIAELERRVTVLMRQLRETRRSRDLWKHRAMLAERNRPRRKVAA